MPQFVTTKAGGGVMLVVDVSPIAKAAKTLCGHPIEPFTRVMRHPLPDVMTVNVDAVKEGKR